MAYSIDEYVGNGSRVDHTLSFPYISMSHVKVEVDESVAAFTWLSKTQIRLNTAPGNGVKYRIFRQTPTGDLLADFQDGSMLDKDVLDIVTLQNLYVSQETFDKADGTTSLAGQYRDEAKNHADSAWSSKIIAEISKTAAANSAAAAESSKITATSAETSAQSYRDSAKYHRDSTIAIKDDAVASATSALEEATRSASAATLAQTYRDEALAHCDTAGEHKDIAYAAMADAKTAKNTAVENATAAATSAGEASNHKNQALVYRDSALTAKTDAETAASSAATDANKAQVIITDTATQLLEDLKAQDGGGSGLDADRVDGFEADVLMGLTRSAGVSNPDPNDLNAGYFMTKHANTPDPSFYWIIHTMQLHVDKLAKSQIAMSCSGGDSYMYYRQRITVTGWTAWRPCFKHNMALLGYRDQPGTWTLTGLKLWQPLVLSAWTVDNGADTHAQWRIVSGSTDGWTNSTTRMFAFRTSSDTGASTAPSCVIIPNESTVTIEVKTIIGQRMYAAQ